MLTSLKNTVGASRFSGKKSRNVDILVVDVSKIMSIKLYFDYLDRLILC